MQKKGHFDVIRTIACLLIINHHLRILNIPVLSILARTGFIMNTVFIIMSGYLLTQSVKNKKITFQWLKRRILRIYPALIISIIIIGAVSITFNLSAKMSITEFLVYLTGFHYFLMGTSLVSPQLWFVTVILLCYLLFKPAMYFIGTRPDVYFIALIVIFCGFTFLVDTYSGRGLSFYSFKGNIYERIISERHLRFFYSFIIFCLAMYYARIHEKIKPTKIMKMMCVFILPPISAGLYVYSFAVMGSNVILNVICLVASLLCAISLCVILTATTPLLKKHLYIFTFLSSISYEIYLIHYVVFAVCKNYLSPYLCYVLVYSLSILLAAIVHKLANIVVNQGLQLKLIQQRQH